MVSQDLKDAYLHVPIHLSHWRYLRFALRNAGGDLVVYQWKVLPFHCLRVFTKLLDPVAAHLHLQGCLMYPYIDDIFHAKASLRQVPHALNLSLRCHFTLGFIVNLTKSALIPSQVMLHLGAMIDMAKGVVFPSPDRLTQVSAQCLPRVTDLMASCHSLVPLCTFHLCPLLNLLRDHFNLWVDQPMKLILLSSISRDLVICRILVLVESSLPGCPSPATHPHPRPDHNRIQLWMWGHCAVPCWQGASGREIMLVALSTIWSWRLFSLKKFQRWLCETHVLVQMDSTMVVYIP